MLANYLDGSLMTILVLLVVFLDGIWLGSLVADSPIDPTEPKELVTSLLSKVIQS